MECNTEVKEKLKSSSQSLMWQLLTFLELSFPHKKGENSQNEQRYNIIRQKVLRLGNDSIRDMELLMDSVVCIKKYELVKVMNQNLETEIISFKTRIGINKLKGEE